MFLPFVRTSISESWFVDVNMNIFSVGLELFNTTLFEKVIPLSGIGTEQGENVKCRKDVQIVTVKQD